MKRKLIKPYVKRNRMVQVFYNYECFFGNTDCPVTICGVINKCALPPEEKII